MKRFYPKINSSTQIKYLLLLHFQREKVDALRHQSKDSYDMAKIHYDNEAYDAARQCIEDAWQTYHSLELHDEYRGELSPTFKCNMLILFINILEEVVSFK